MIFPLFSGGPQSSEADASGHRRNVWLANSKHALLSLIFMLSITGCNQPKTQPQPTAFKMDTTSFNPQQAFTEVENFLAIGSRDSGTPGAKKAADYLVARMQALGLTAERQTFEDKTPTGVMTFHNAIGLIPGTTEKIIVLGSHFDTKTGIENFVGANDSGSSTGLLLELGRILALQKNLPFTIMLAFFDGEECQVRYSPIDGFHGSEYLARKLVQEGKSEQVEAVVILDMIGDKDLHITVPRNSDPKLIQLAFAAAGNVGHRASISLLPGMVGDDHVPFLEMGMPATDLIDFKFGHRPEMNNYWHTSEDTIDKISAESLGITGRITLEMIRLLAEPK